MTTGPFTGMSRTVESSTKSWIKQVSKPIGSRIQAQVRETVAERIADCLHVQKEPLAEVPGAGAAGRRIDGTYFGDGTWDKKASLELGYDFIAIGDKVEHSARYPDFRRPDLILARLGLARL